MLKEIGKKALKYLSLAFIEFNQLLSGCHLDTGTSGSFLSVRNLLMEKKDYWKAANVY